MCSNEKHFPTNYKLKQQNPNRARAQGQVAPTGPHRKKQSHKRLAEPPGTRQHAKPSRTKQTGSQERFRNNSSDNSSRPNSPGVVSLLRFCPSETQRQEQGETPDAAGPHPHTQRALDAEQTCAEKRGLQEVRGVRLRGRLLATDGWRQ